MFSFSLSSDDKRKGKKEVNCLLKGLGETRESRDPKQKSSQKERGSEVHGQAGVERVLKGFLEDKAKTLGQGAINDSSHSKARSTSLYTPSKTQTYSLPME